MKDEPAIRQRAAELREEIDLHCNLETTPYNRRRCESLRDMLTALLWVLDEPMPAVDESVFGVVVDVPRLT